MLKRTFTIFVAIIIAMSLLGCSSKIIGSEEYTVSGRAISSKGGILSGVTLKIDGETVATTDAGGTYSIKALKGKKKLTASIDGYKILPKEIILSYNRADADFNATAIPVEPEPPVPPVSQTTWPILADEVVFDGFDNGLNFETWDIVNKKWGLNTAFQGCVPTNVNYTEDGVLSLTSKGNNYPNPSEKNTTACIVSKEAIGPGRYDIVAKIAPRLGVCSAIWLFYYGEVDNGKTLNQEIDIIEVPGQSKQSLERMMNTNYRYEDVTDGHHETAVTAGNDGEWHKYSIEWSVKDKYIKYYTDDVLTYNYTGEVPDRKMQLWIGTWQPMKNWVGEADFEQADMLIDRVSYKPFNETAADGVKEALPEYLEKKVAGQPAFPSKPIKLVETDYISNGTFSGTESAWTKSASSDSSSSVVNLNYLATEKAYRMKNATTVSQTISAMYKDFTFDFSIKGKVLSDSGALSVKIEYLNYNNAVVGAPITHNFLSGADYNLFETKLQVPASGERIRITFISTAGTIGLIDDVSMIRTYKSVA